MSHNIGNRLVLFLCSYGGDDEWTTPGNTPCTCRKYNSDGTVTHLDNKTCVVSFMGTATSIIFAATSILLSRQNTSSVATKLCLSRQKLYLWQLPPMCCCRVGVIVMMTESHRKDSLYLYLPKIQFLSDNTIPMAPCNSDNNFKKERKKNNIYI